jgi:hypothetical protein
MDVELLDSLDNIHDEQKMLKQRLLQHKLFFYLKKHRHLRFCVLFVTGFFSIYIFILIKFSKKPDALDYFPDMCHVYPNDLSNSTNSLIFIQMAYYYSLFFFSSPNKINRERFLAIH